MGRTFRRAAIGVSVIVLVVSLAGFAGAFTGRTVGLQDIEAAAGGPGGKGAALTVSAPVPILINNGVGYDSQRMPGATAEGTSSKTLEAYGQAKLVSAESKLAGMHPIEALQNGQPSVASIVSGVDVIVPVSARAWAHANEHVGAGLARSSISSNPATAILVESGASVGAPADEGFALPLTDPSTTLQVPRSTGEPAPSSPSPNPVTSSQATPESVIPGIWAAVVGGSLLLLIVPLLRRFLSAERVLDSTIRKRLLEIVHVEPGLGLSDVAKRAGVLVSHADYHLNALTEFGFVVRVKVGGSTGFFPTDGERHEDRVRHLLERNSKTKTVMAYVAVHPAATVREVASACNLSPAGAHWHLCRIRESGLSVGDRASAVIRQPEQSAASL